MTPFAAPSASVRSRVRNRVHDLRPSLLPQSSELDQFTRIAMCRPAAHCLSALVGLPTHLAAS
jgi:hypothetical protein